MFMRAFLFRTFFNCFFRHLGCFLVAGKQALTLRWTIHSDSELFRFRHVLSTLHQCLGHAIYRQLRSRCCIDPDSLEGFTDLLAQLCAAQELVALHAQDLCMFHLADIPAKHDRQRRRHMIEVRNHVLRLNLRLTHENAVARNARVTLLAPPASQKELPAHGSAKPEAKPHSQGQVLAQRMFTPEPVRVGERQGRHCSSLDIAEMAGAGTAQPARLLQIPDASAFWTPTLGSIVALSWLCSTADRRHSPGVQEPPHGCIARMLNRASMQLSNWNLGKHCTVLVHAQVNMHLLFRRHAQRVALCPQCELPLLVG